MRAAQPAVTSSFPIYQDMMSMYGVVPPSLALFTRMEEDKKLVDEVVADQKRGRETGAGLLDSSLKIGLRV